MAKLLKLRRGTTTQHASFTGAEGELTIDTTKDTAVVHDGSTQAGTPLAKEDMSNVSSTNIVSRIGASALAGTKVQPNFGSQNIETTGTISAGNDITLNSSGNTKTLQIKKGTTVSAMLGHIGSGDEGFLTLKDGGTDTLVMNGETNGVSYINSGNLGLGKTTASQKLDVNGNIAVSGTVDGRDVAADGSKLDGIESGATGDQTATEILNAIKTVDGPSSGLNADLLDNMHASDTAGNSTIVARNSAGYIFSNYINTTDNSVSTSVSGIVCKTGDDYHRTSNAAGVRTFLNVENGATADQTGGEIGLALNGENVGSSGTGVQNVYNKGWFRNEDSGDGMYIQSTGQHWYSDNDDYWNVAGGGSANGIRFRDDHNRTIRGYVYANNSNQIGFLNTSGNWSLKCDNSGNVTATGNVTAYSDERLKTNVNTINNALSIVGKLRGVSFDWKESGKPSIGVIAQEVEKVLPELVLTQQVLDPTGESEIKSVDYGKIVGVLINAINELKAEVDKLKGGK